jgi:replicative DNA helicase
VKIKQHELAYLITFNRELYLLATEIGGEQLFESHILKDIYRTASEFYDRYGTSPTFESFFTAFEKHYSKKYQLLDIVALKKSFQTLRDSIQPELAEFYADHLKELYRKKQAEEVIRRGISYIESGNIDSFVHDVVKHLSLENKYIRSGKLLSDAEEIGRYLQNIEDTRIQTLIPILDKVLGGGFAPRELVIVLGGTGGGKTAFLINLGWAAVMQKKRVLYYTFEVAMERVLARAICHILQKPYQEIIRNPKKTKQLLEEHRMSPYMDNFKVIEAPTFTMTVPQLEAHIEMEIIKEGKPDMIIVDYADIMLPSQHYSDRWLELENSYMYLRSIAQKHDAVLITASQVNREGAQATKIKNEHIKGAYGKTQNADVVIALNRSAEDKEKGTVKISINKNRNYVADQVIEVMVNFETMTFYQPVTRNA